MEETVEQTMQKNKTQEQRKPLEKMIKTKIFGIVIVIFTVLWTFLSLYEFLTFGTEIISFHVPIAVVSYIIGIALLVIKNKGIYHTLITLCGMILLAFYVYIIILLRIFG